MGFWSGFAQGWEAESERIERRKLFQQEQTERRAATLGELLPKFVRGGALGAAAGGSDDATPASADHYITALGRYGMTTEQVAKINSEGGVHGLKAAVDLLNENQENLTPELLSRIPDAIIVTQRETGTVDPKAVTENIFGPGVWEQFEPEQRALIELQAESLSQPAEPFVTTVLPTPKPINSEVINGTVKAANDTLMVELAARKAEADQMAASTEDPDQKGMALMEATRLEGLMTQVQEGNPLPAIQEVGQDIIGPYLENNPMLKQNPAVLGPWKFAAEAYLTGGMSGGEESATQTSFTSVEEAQAAIKAGRVPRGAVFYINGEAYENDL